MTSSIDSTDFTEEDYRFDHPKYKPLIEPQQLLYPILPETIQWSIRLGSPTLRIQRLSSTDNSSFYQIDKILSINVPSDTFRSSMVNHWSTRQSSARTKAWLSGIITILTGVAGFAARKGLAGVTAAAQAANPTAIALGAAALAVSSVYTAYQIYKMNQAAHQKKGWETSPADAVAAERRKAYLEGFIYAYNRHLKWTEPSHGVLLPFEVQFLFEKYFDNFCNKFLSNACATDQQKKAWLDEFRHYNPVSASLLEYAYGEIPEKYKMISSDYEHLAAFLNNLRQECETLRKEKRLETESLIQKINNQRTLALTPFNLMLEHWTNEAKRIRDEELAKLSEDDAASRKKVEDDYQSSVQKYQTFYAIAAFPVNQYFDQKVEDVNYQLKSILDTIKANEATTAASYFNYALGLLSYAQQLKQANYIYSQSTFTPSFVLHMPPLPPAPSIQVDYFVDQAQHPENLPGISQSQYADYLQFVQWQQESEATPAG